ncbi:cyclic nucleotide-binding domain-containing protein [Paraliomyxa miuraensis]|uniref:cyclic nucleotide-binding domain-containing protein n=1 Tax=Paraliomyxa miuraensis TaxID=376150 RepID=UPI00224E69B3|nr:cyclic nucleotide-binding domain-containing protein [Paraliomyxa miuraensis]MCX4245847.1 cyclic nucleotide-binding domain-containing protein [Paraliomyxa miuraensis]
MEINYWAGTDVGRKRSDNEDNFLIDKRLKLFVVADGMGGHASGEIASAMAVHGIREIIDQERDILDVYDDDDPKSHVEVCTLLEYAVHHTCAQIFEKARREPEKRGMGTTLVVLLIIGARGFIAYVGDSRIYLLRGGIVYQLTEDHSLRNELIRMGKITADEFESSPYANLKNAMTRAVGVYESVEVDTLDFDIIPGDAFLMCSDGLYEYLSDDDIANALALPKIREVPGMLIDTANSRGGKDNITAVVVQVAGDDGDEGRAADLNLTLDTLKNVQLFRELSYQQLVRIINLSRQSAVEEGQVLFHEGEPGAELMVVIRGSLQITRNGVPVTELGVGSHLGEMSLIDAGPRSATATMVEAGKVLTITRDDFYEVLRREPALAVKLLWSFVRVLAKRLRTTTADLAAALTHAGALPQPDASDEDTIRGAMTSKTEPALDALEPDAPETDEPDDVVELLEASDELIELVDVSIEPAEFDALDEPDDLEERPTVISGTLEPSSASVPPARKTIVETTTKAPSETPEIPPPTTSAPIAPGWRPPSGPVRTADAVAPPTPQPRPPSGPSPHSATDGPAPAGTRPRRRGPQVTKPSQAAAWSPSLQPMTGAPVVSPQAPTAPLDAPHLRPRPERDAPRPKLRAETARQLPTLTDGVGPTPPVVPAVPPAPGTPAPPVVPMTPPRISAAPPVDVPTAREEGITQPLTPPAPRVPPPPTVARSRDADPDDPSPNAGESDA